MPNLDSAGRLWTGAGTAGDKVELLTGLPESDGVERGCLVNADAEGGEAQFGCADCPPFSCIVLVFVGMDFLCSDLNPDVDFAGVSVALDSVF